MRILINTISTKKQSGGAIQIAYNFILKTLEANTSDIEWYYVVSSDLNDILGDKFKDKLGETYFVFPTQPDFNGTYSKVKKALGKLESALKPDVVYTITAPSYFSFKAPEVMRFTNPWVTHPNKYSWASLPFSEKIRQKLYCSFQKLLMRKASFFITQTETTKQGIVRVTGIDQSKVKVVNNVLPSIFNKIDNTGYQSDGNWVDIACVGAPVPHKNMEIIPSVLKELMALGINSVRFHTTIPEELPIWNKIKKELSLNGLSNRVVNHGRLSQQDLGEMYKHCQLCFLPTLLEVFSASTLEAIYFKLGIVATDFPFNKEVLGDDALYYEPMNAKAAAKEFAIFVNDKNLLNEYVEKSQARLNLYGDYNKHFNAIVAFLKECNAKS